MMITWPTMTIDEYADLERGSDVSLVKNDGIWWRETQCCFFRPLFPFLQFADTNVKIPDKARFGGVQFPVSSEAESNSILYNFVYTDLNDYSLDSLSKNRRKKTKKSMKEFEARSFKNVDTFKREAYPVYCQFQKRTKYNFNRKRSGREYFNRWAEYQFRFKKIRIIGLYINDKLCAVTTSYKVEDIIFDAALFSNDECMNYNMLDFQIHIIRESAVHADAKYIFAGRSSSRKSLDESKIHRGNKILRQRAFYQMHPLIKIGLKCVRRNDYNRLTGNIPYLKNHPALFSV